MKKTILIIAGALFFASCSNESLAITSQENLQTDAMKNFRQAMINMSKPENLATPEEQRMKNFPEMSDRRKNLLLPAAKELIQSTGISDSHINTETSGDKGAIINWALDIYIENTKPSKHKN
jgi:hypothetical protein